MKLIEAEGRLFGRCFDESILTSREPAGRAMTARRSIMDFMLSSRRRHALSPARTRGTPAHNNGLPK